MIIGKIFSFRIITYVAALLLSLDASYATTKYRILFVYSSRGLSYIADPLVSVESAIQTVNLVYSNSMLDIEAEIAGVLFTPPPAIGWSPFAYNNLEILRNNYSNPLYQTPWIAEWKGRYSADVVIFLDDYSGCGLAITADWAADLKDGTWAYATWDPTCDGKILAHEIAHLFGAQHAALAFPGTYQHGFCSPSPQTWSDLMGGDCPVGGSQWNNTQLWFSNPYQTFGSPAVARGEAVQRNVSQMHADRIDTVSSNEVTPFNLALSGNTTGLTGATIGDQEYADAVAKGTITLTGNYVIEGNGIAQFRAGESIVVEPGLTIHEGSSVSFLINTNFATLPKKHVHSAKSDEKDPNQFDFNLTYAAEAVTLTYMLPGTGRVQAEFFTLDGQRVLAREWTGRKGSGSYHLTWPRKIERHGIIICRLSQGKKSVTSKFLVSK